MNSFNRSLLCVEGTAPTINPILDCLKERLQLGGKLPHAQLLFVQPGFQVLHEGHTLQRLSV